MNAFYLIFSAGQYQEGKTMLDYDSLQTSKTEDPPEPPETDDSQPKQSQSFLDKGKENFEHL